MKIDQVVLQQLRRQEETPAVQERKPKPKTPEKKEDSERINPEETPVIRYDAQGRPLLPPRSEQSLIDFFE